MCDENRTVVFQNRIQQNEQYTLFSREYKRQYCFISIKSNQ